MPYITRNLITLFITSCVIYASVAHAVEYDCTVEKKINSERTYTDEHLKKFQFSVKIKENAGVSYVSRCSCESEEEGITCDEYEANEVIFDERAKIKKFYMFRPQFDMQVFSDFSFVENNGRGTIAYGKCKVVAP